MNVSVNYLYYVPFALSKCITSFMFKLLNAFLKNKQPYEACQHSPLLQLVLPLQGSHQQEHNKLVTWTGDLHWYQPPPPLHVVLIHDRLGPLSCQWEWCCCLICHWCLSFLICHWCLNCPRPPTRRAHCVGLCTCLLGSLDTYTTILGVNVISIVHHCSLGLFWTLGQILFLGAT